MGASGAIGGASGRGEERTDSAKAKIKAATQMVAGQSLITGTRSISAILPARSSPKHLLSRAGDATDRVEPREAGTPEAQLNYPSRPGARGLRRAAEALVPVRPSKCKDPRTPLGISPRASGGGR